MQNLKRTLRRLGRLTNFRKRELRSTNRRSNLAEFLIEPLECREMLAGQVTVDISSTGDIILIGDNRDNSIEFIEGNSAISIIGTDETLLRYDGMTITELQVTNGGEVLGDFKVQLKGGNDRLVIENMLFRGDAVIDLGSGDDELAVTGRDGDFYEDLVITSGTGADELLFDSAGVSGNFSLDLRGASNSFVISDGYFVEFDFDVKSRGGNDSVILGDEGRVIGNLTMDLGGGADLVQIENTEVFGNTNIDMGSSRKSDELPGDLVSIKAERTRNAEFRGDVTITGAGGFTGVGISSDGRAVEIGGDLTIETGGGSDFVFFDWNDANDLRISGDVLVETGSGEDFVRFEGQADEFQQALFRTTINTGGGSDQVELSHVRFTRRLDIDTGGGSDLLTLLDTSTEALSVHMQGGRDSLTLDSAFLGSGSQFDGGGGFDRILEDRWFTFGATADFFSFEETPN